MQWLKGEGGQLAGELVKDLAPLREYWADPHLGEGERFLRDFILDKGYMQLPYHIDR